MTSERYVEMLNNFLVPKLKNFAGYYQRTWCQKYGATSYISLPRVREIFLASMQPRFDCYGFFLYKWKVLSSREIS